MIDIVAIRNFIVAEMHFYTDLPVVPTDTVSPRPDMPFYSYKFTSPYIPEPGQPISKYENISNIWLRKWRYEMPKMVMSVNAYDSDIDDCYQAALNMRRYFEVEGRFPLSSEGIVVVAVEPVQDRTVLLNEVSYEFRAGFDVIFRVTSEIEVSTETINTVSY